MFSFSLPASLKHEASIFYLSFMVIYPDSGTSEQSTIFTQINSLLKHALLSYLFWFFFRRFRSATEKKKLTQKNERRESAAAAASTENHSTIWLSFRFGFFFVSRFHKHRAMRCASKDVLIELWKISIFSLLRRLYKLGEHKKGGRKKMMNTMERSEERGREAIRISMPFSFTHFVVFAIPRHRANKKQVVTETFSRSTWRVVGGSGERWGIRRINFDDIDELFRAECGGSVTTTVQTFCRLLSWRRSRVFHSAVN